MSHVEQESDSLMPNDVDCGGSIPTRQSENGVIQGSLIVKAFQGLVVGSIVICHSHIQRHTETAVET